MHLCKLIIPLLLCLLANAAVVAENAPYAPTRQAKSSRLSRTFRSLIQPQVIAALRLGDYGSQLVRFGRLGHDGRLAAVFVQSDSSRQITCVTAISLSDGSLLWQDGATDTNNFRVFADLPVQVFDWNKDEVDDVIFFKDNEIRILNGADGSILQSVPAYTPYSLYIYHPNRLGERAGLVLHHRGGNVLLNSDLAVEWAVENTFSHFPMSVDIDGDGDPELLSNYRMIRSDGSVIWQRDDIGMHNDAANWGDVTCSGQTEIAIATSGKSILLNREGKTIWRGVEDHAQHITIGSFLPSNCAKQVATIDRDKKGSGILRLYDSRGRILWEKGGMGEIAMMTRLDSWVPDVSESLILISRSADKPPTIYDGRGNIVARLPFPPARVRQEGVDRYTKHFAQHFDIDGDGVEEILLSNEKALWIYANRGRRLRSVVDKPRQTLPHPRVFNSTFYTGQ